MNNIKTLMLDLFKKYDSANHAAWAMLDLSCDG